MQISLVFPNSMVEFVFYVHISDVKTTQNILMGSGIEMITHKKYSKSESGVKFNQHQYTAID